MKTARAFTLIELLIVLAIIGILAAIATVNFQEAQVRAKTARVRSDMRTLAGALESYRVDNPAYPLAYAAQGDLMITHPLNVITTPIAYATTVPPDPFGIASYNFNPNLKGEGHYYYRDAASTSVGLASQTFGYIWQELPEKKYFLHSSGPNRIYDVVPYIEYDPTNGTVSTGDITRFGP